MGRGRSLCWIAPEIGSINLHTVSHACNDTNLAKTSNGPLLPLCPQDRDVEPPARPLASVRPSKLRFVF